MHESLAVETVIRGRKEKRKEEQYPLTIGPIVRGKKRKEENVWRDQ